MTYLFIAYSIIWVALLAYALALSHRQKGLVAEIERLERALARKSEA